jgi:hypothetical protein
MAGAGFCISTSLGIPHPIGVVQQLREAFSEAGPYRYAILDHDSKFDADVIAFLKPRGQRWRLASVIDTRRPNVIG